MHFPSALKTVEGAPAPPAVGCVGRGGRQSGCRQAVNTGWEPPVRQAWETMTISSSGANILRSELGPCQPPETRIAFQHAVVAAKKISVYRTSIAHCTQFFYNLPNPRAFSEYRGLVGSPRYIKYVASKVFFWLQKVH